MPPSRSTAQGRQEPPTSSRYGHTVHGWTALDTALHDTAWSCISGVSEPLGRPRRGSLDGGWDRSPNTATKEQITNPGRQCAMLHAAASRRSVDPSPRGSRGPTTNASYIVHSLLGAMTAGRRSTRGVLYELTEDVVCLGAKKTKDQHTADVYANAGKLQFKTTM